MRRALAVDGNHSQIVETLRQAGALVQSLVRVGDGTPDLVVGFRRRVYFLEVKDPSQPPNKRRLTPAEATWHRLWQGFEVHVVETPHEALRAIGAVSQDSPTGGTP